MASKRKYGYYIKGNKIAIIEEGTGSGVCSLSGYSSQSTCEDAGGTWTENAVSTNDGEYRSPVATVSDGLEIQYAYSPFYKIPDIELAGASAGDRNKFFVNGWIIVDGYLTLVRSGYTWSGATKVDVDDNIYIGGSERWNGLHKIQEIQDSGDVTHGGIKTYTKVADNAPYIDDNIVNWVAGTHYEVTKVVCVADSGDSLDGKYFDIYSATGKTEVWIDTDDSGTSQPTGSGSYAANIEVTEIETGNTANQVASAIAVAIDDAGILSCEVQGDTIYITDAAQASRTDASAGDSGFTVSVETEGGSGADSIILLSQYSVRDVFTDSTTTPYLWISGSDAAVANNGMFSEWTSLANNTTLDLSSATRHSFTISHITENEATPSFTADASEDIYIYKAHHDPSTYFITDVDVLNDESDTIDLPRYQANAIVYYLKAKLAEDMGDMERREFFMREFRRQLEKSESVKKRGPYIIQGLKELR